MINKETLEGMTAEQVMQKLQEVKEQRRIASNTVNGAIRDYEKAVAARDTKIQSVKNDLKKQLADIAAKSKALNAALLKATMAGDSTGANEAQRTLTELASLRPQLAARLELLDEKPLRCDDEYNAMNAAVADSEAAETRYSEDICVIREFCEETVHNWEKIISELRTYGSIVDRTALERAHQHYSHDR